ncbi:hypothetical protein CR205_10915 [Alteribacter lacisalsi]|uniref:DUF5625 domain-containing protein n=1 Tax=Alteribacter lacisalsi TaxID=2045244 RepID=A0A2W0HAZ7_9BACI|nr:hypothetical protein [Alteribacter lacisalsi]PYZ99043.1 hypothetical protein CR205_10915 [Alteribacter lacisalsi]
MKGSIAATLSFIALYALIAGCSGQDYMNDIAEASPPVISETQSGDFIIRLLADQAEYKESDNVGLKAKLKYIGEEDEVTISHRTSPFWYRIQEVTRGIEIPYIQDSPGSVMTLERDVWYEENYVRKGTINSQASDRERDFIRSFAEGPHFPAGEYEIELNSDFFVEKDGERKKHIMSTGLIITVD